jgi:hypothetical protein
MKPLWILISLYIVRLYSALSQGRYVNYAIWLGAGGSKLGWRLTQ